MNALLTRNQAAQALGIAIATLDNWRSQRRGPVYLKIDATIKYREDIQNFIAGCAVDPRATKETEYASEQRKMVRPLRSGREWSTHNPRVWRLPNEQAKSTADGSLGSSVGPRRKGEPARLTAIPFGEAATQFLSWAGRRIQR
jgi:hypothetical protein